MKHTLSWLWQDRGAQIAEFATVVPLLIGVIFGILWFARALNIYTTVNHAAQAAARLGGAPSCATCSPRNALPSPATIKSTVVDPIFQASHLAPPSSTDFTLRHGQSLEPSGTVIGTVVTIRYSYNVTIRGLTCCPPALIPLSSGITINATAQTPEEN